MGIGYVDSIVLYNQYENEDGKQYYVGTRFDNVRIELTQGVNVQKSGLENADVCLVKIQNVGTLPKKYTSPGLWKELSVQGKEEKFTIDTENDNFFVIVKKQELGIDIEVPTGTVDSDSYRGGYYQYIREKYGHAYAVHTLNVYQLIPRFEVGGR